MNDRRLCPLCLSLSLCLMILVLLLVLSSNPSRAQGSALYVAPGGSCGGVAPCYANIQSAVDDASAGDVIKVSTGNYSGVQGRPAPAGYNGPSVVTQVVYISKTVIIRGGYAASTFAEPPDPDAHPTILDAQGQGRVLFIAGNINPTIEGLCITGGDAAGLKGWGSGWDAGGGVYIISATATFDNNLVFGNLARGGGGLYLQRSASTLNSNTVSTNTAAWSGGGLLLVYSDATLDRNIIYTNTATSFDGGGLHLSYSAANLTDNTIAINRANSGGGVYLVYSPATFSRNIIEGNSAINGGGGLFLYSSAATLRGNSIAGNTAEGSSGGGLYLRQSNADLENNLVVDNFTSVSGSALYIWTSFPRLLHTTIARNTGGDGTGIYVTDNRITYSTVTFTNTIIVSHAVGITVASGNTVALEATLWGTATWANNIDWAGAGNINPGTINIRKDPAFEDPARGDCHITAASAALDQGVNAGVSTDVDGDPRPMRSGYDIGADEFPSPPTASFTHSSPDWVGQTTVFTNTTVPSVTSAYLWTFGDGMTSTLKNPIHAYSAAGLYTVILTATNRAGSDTTTDTLIVYGKPSAGFWGQPRQGIAPLTVAFIDTTSTNPAGDPTLKHLWHFGDGSTSIQSDPTHDYATAGIYSVTLVVGNAAGSDELTYTRYVTVYETVHAGFTAVPTSGLAPLDVSFTNLSTGDYTASMWNFGDGMTSTAENPTHTYALAGVYSVTLAIDGPGGSGLETKAEYIIVKQRYRVFLPFICARVWPYLHEECTR